MENELSRAEVFWNDAWVSERPPEEGDVCYQSSLGYLLEDNERRVVIAQTMHVADPHDPCDCLTIPRAYVIKVVKL